MILALENQVVSLEIAKEMKELGCSQESLFYWSDDGTKYHRFKLIYRENDRNWGAPMYGISAYTAAELGELLPRVIYKEKRTYKLAISHEIRNDKPEWSVRYECETNNGYWQQASDTEADARGSMRIYLKKHGLI